MTSPQRASGPTHELAIAQRVLAVEYPSSILTAPDGSGCAVTFRSPGKHATRLYRQDGVLSHIIPGTPPLVWHRGAALTSRAGKLERWSLDDTVPEQLAYFPGRRVAAAAGDDLWLASATGLWRHTVAGAEVFALGLDRRLLGNPTLSPTGALVAVTLVEDGGSAASLRLYSRTGEELLRWHEPGWCVFGCAFAGEELAVISRMRRDSTAREYVVLEIGSGERYTLHREQSVKGFAPLPAACTAGASASYLKYVAGWPLVCVHDLSTGAEVVVNPGRHEDLTDVDDAPAFSPSGRLVAFNSSVADLRERHLYTYDLVTNELRRRSFAAGATGAKAWLSDDRLVFVESEASSGAALRWLDLGGPQTRPRTAGRGALPTAVTLEGPDGPVPADLYLPTGGVEGEPRPAMVYAHGGVFRQLTRGYPASYAYTLLHEINLGLLELGFVVMSVEYRGSMGFGLEHDQGNYLACGDADSADCALAARHLAGLPFVDASRIGIWGLSWGGTMTLQALVKYPELFAAGVNLAGIWNFEQRARYWNDLQAGRPIYFTGRIGPPGSESRLRSSAHSHAARLRAPLLSVHGTQDESVDYQQHEALLADAARLGKRVEALTLEGESHVFGSAEAWRRAVPLIVGFLSEHLLATPSGGEGGE